MCVIADKLVKRGIEQGRLLGEKEGMERGIERGGLLLVRSLIKDGLLKLEDGAKYMDMSAEVLNEKLQYL